MAAVDREEVALFEALAAPDPERLTGLSGAAGFPWLLERERLGPLAAWVADGKKDADSSGITVLGYADKRRSNIADELKAQQICAEIEAADPGIQPVVLKGLHFARSLYPPGARPFCDIDLFLPRRRLPCLAALLKRLGWEPLDDPRTSKRLWANWVHLAWRRGGNLIEVHFDLVPPGRYRGCDDLWLRRRRLELEGGGIWTPDPEDAALVALTHLAKEHLFQPHLLWVMDIHRMAPEVDWDLVAVRARRWGLERLPAFMTAYLRRYPSLRRRLPPGRPLPRTPFWEWMLAAGAKLVQPRARLLGLLLTDEPRRAPYMLRRALCGPLPGICLDSDSGGLD